MKKIAEKTFVSDLVLEYSYTPTPNLLGTYKSTMILYKDTEDYYMIEWDIPELEDTWNIGLWTDPEDPRIIVDYDGLFELPKQAIELLKENGFITREVE